jgi:hypothetical protein
MRLAWRGGREGEIGAPRGRWSRLELGTCGRDAPVDRVQIDIDGTIVGRF